MSKIFFSTLLIASTFASVFASNYFVNLNHSSEGVSVSQNSESFTLTIPTTATYWYLYQAEGAMPVLTGTVSSSSAIVSSDYVVLPGYGNYIVITSDDNCDIISFSECINGTVKGYSSFSIADYKGEDDPNSFILVNTTIVALVALFWLMREFLNRK